MAYADYDYYRNEFYGNAIAEADFHGLAVRASALADYYTGGQARMATGDALTAVKNAVCALAAVMRDEDRLNASAFSADRASQVKSETVGGWSRSYGSSAASAADLELLARRRRDAVLLYLGGTGMLEAAGYRGCSR